MKRRYLSQALLVASLGAFAATGYAQTNTPTDATPGPGAAAPAAASGSGVGTTATGTANTTGTTAGTGATTQPMSAARIRAYEHARANCEAGPAAQRSECQAALSKEYAGVPGPCQKLTGNALDACVHGDYPANAGMPAKTTK